MDSRTVLGLDGSPRHLIGLNLSEGKLLEGMGGGSLAPYLVAKLVKELGDDLRPGYAPHDLAKHVNPHSLGAVYHATTKMAQPVQSLEFVAKRLLYGKLNPRDEDRRDVLLGKPIYVALPDWTGWWFLPRVR